MDKNSNIYVFGFATLVTLIVAVTLASISEGLRPLKEKNAAVYKKREILSSVMNAEDLKLLDDDAAEAAFSDFISQLVVNSAGEKVEIDGQPFEVDIAKEDKKAKDDRVFPLFVYENGEDKKYIFPVRGLGLWDAIWGYVAVEDDLNTISGTAFGHAAETPGLGAEIKDNKGWIKQFEGKKLYDKSGEYKSVTVKKGPINDPDHQVDAIAGATITGDGVTVMLFEDIKSYIPYLNTLKN